MANQVQMVYLDPPYGIRYGSNFQPFVNKREVNDGRDEDLTHEAEMIRAFRSAIVILIDGIWPTVVDRGCQN